MEESLLKDLNLKIIAPSYRGSVAISSDLRKLRDLNGNAVPSRFGKGCYSNSGLD
jgi:hypothetical protein